MSWSSERDLHRSLTELDNLEEILSWQEERAVSNRWNAARRPRRDADNDSWPESASARPIPRRFKQLRIYAAQFLPQHAAQRALQVPTALARDVLAQGFVDQGLVVSTASYAIAEPLDDVRIEANGDSFLRGLDDGAALALGEVVFVAHGSALLVVAALGNRGRPRRNDADGLLVGLGVDDDQDACEGVDPGQDETRFGVMVGIGHRAGQLVVEDLHGVGEVDSVLTPIGQTLRLIPLELDVHTVECMHKCPTLPGATKSGSRKKKQARRGSEGRKR